ncbi:MAG: hypothetical protein AB7P49_17820, partial [Bdellovibrionales bacterium]
LLVLSMVLAACASDAEKQERRENAFDVSGSYKATRASGSDLDIGFEIANESGRHDIVIRLERLSPVTDKEREFLTSAGLDADRVFKHFGSHLELGRGYDKKHLEGGENVSDSFGESTRFFVCTPEFQYDAEYRLLYCLGGSISKKDKNMDGRLELRWIRERKVTIDGKAGKEISAANMELKFRSDVSQVFYKQYLGHWSGDIFQLREDFDISSFGTLVLVQNFSSDTYVVQPKRETIPYRGESYTYDSKASQFSIEDLKRPSYPAVQAVFQGPHGKRIVLFGQIWSLGNLTGNIVLIESEKQTDLATFRHKKD